MFKKYIVFMLFLLMLGLVGCGTPEKSNTSKSKTINVIVYEADTIDIVTRELMTSVMDTLNARFNDLGFVSITIERVGDKQLKVQLNPSNPDIQQITKIVGQPNKVKLVGQNNEVILTDQDIKSAILGKDETYKTFDIQLSPDASIKLLNATQSLIGKRISFYLDDEILTTLMVTQAITDGAIQVPGSSTIQEAKILSTIINLGKTLPFPLKVISINSSLIGI